MSLVKELFGCTKAVIGMVHVGALPGTPFSSASMATIIEQAVGEAKVLTASGFDAVMIENMHDRPFLRQHVGPEVIAGMTAILNAVREAIELPLGIQILAGANCEALAVAMAGGATFVRAENFVFAQVADEGLMAEADAGQLLRYRREMGAEHIRIFADIKKKHACHSLTADIDIAGAAKAAAFFGADGVIITGAATAEPVAIDDVRQVSAAVALPIAIGSGVTPENLHQWWSIADVFIIGSYLKLDGIWSNSLDPDRVVTMMRAVEHLSEPRS